MTDHKDPSDDLIPQKPKKGKGPPPGLREIKAKNAMKGNPTKRIRSIVSAVACGATYADAAMSVGMPVDPSHPNRAAEDRLKAEINAKEVFSRPYVKKMVTEYRAQTALEHNIRRDNVVNGMLEAIEMAKTLAEPMTMIAGWREIGRVCGFYEAVKVKVEVGASGASLSARLNQLSDDELLRLVSGGQINERGEIVDGSFERVDDDSTTDGQ